MQPTTADQWEAFFSKHLLKFKKINAKQAEAVCPFHEDSKPSLSINLVEGLWKCHGCGVKGNGITFADKSEIPRDQIPGWENNKVSSKKIVAIYNYQDENSALLSQQIRFEPKAFRQRRPDGAGGWIPNLNETRRVPYRLPELLAAKGPGLTAFIAEGEKDVDTLHGEGLISTCNPMGAGNWRDEYSEWLKGFPEVVIIADKDEAGRKHAQQVAASISNVVDRVKVLELPGDTVKDSTDWFEAGGSVQGLMQLVQAAPLWTPQSISFPNSGPIKGEKQETNSCCMESVPLADFMAGGEAEIEWCVDGLLPAEGTGILGGTSGYGKSWMLLELAIECARGGRWLGQFQTKIGRVLYVDEESTDSLIRKRLKKLLAGKELEGHPLDIHFCIAQGLCFTSDKSELALRAKLEELKPSLVIIDTLIRVYRGEENSATEMAAVFRVVKAIVRDFKCSILFADHQRKLGNFSATGDQLLRGSSEKTAFVDTLLSLQKKDGTLYVEHSKSRFAEAVPPFAITIADDPTKTTTTVKYLGEAAPLKEAARLGPAKEFLYAAITDQWVSRKDLLEQAKEKGISERPVDDALRVLLEQNTLEIEKRKPVAGPGGRQAFYHKKVSLVPPDNPFHVSDPIYTGKDETNSEATPVHPHVAAVQQVFGGRVRP